jgi:hypothetical protein
VAGVGAMQRAFEIAAKIATERMEKRTPVPAAATA